MDDKALAGKPALPLNPAAKMLRDSHGLSRLGKKDLSWMQDDFRPLFLPRQPIGIGSTDIDDRFDSLSSGTIDRQNRS